MEYSIIKKPKEVFMNCLLLLFILFCCGNGQNGNSTNNNCHNCNCHVNHCVDSGCRPTPPPPPMPRTQFPYLDKEPCACGCEEN